MIAFLSYGNSKFKVSIGRIEKEALAFGIFDRVFCYKEEDLRKDPIFWKTHGNFIESHPRGNGYWIWKPYLILKTLQSLDDGDFLVYADAGCTLNSKARTTLEVWLERLRTEPAGILLFEIVHREGAWTKKDVFEALNASHLRQTPQRMGGIHFIRKCPESLQFYEELYKLVSDTHLIDDSPSKVANFPEFREHRHDQSCISLLSKLRGILTLPKGYHSAPQNPIWDTRKRF